jgi:tetratricopeptide (TPR) repeat protein
LSEREGDLQKAYDIYNSGLLHKETSLDLTSGKINVLRKMKEYDRAIAEAKEALKANANNVGAYNAIGMVYLERGEVDNALFIYQLAVTKTGGSENALVLSNFGKTLYMKKDVGAKDMLLKALDYDPKLVEARLVLAAIHLDNRGWQPAIDALEPALVLEPNNAQLLNSLGIANRGLGEYDKSIDFYRRALTADPSNPSPLLNISIIQAEHQKLYDDAFASIDEYLGLGGEEKSTAKEWKAEFAVSQKEFEKQKKLKELREKMLRARAEREAKLKASGGGDDSGDTGSDDSDDSDDAPEEEGAEEEDSADDDTGSTDEEAPEGDVEPNEGTPDGEEAPEDGTSEEENSPTEDGEASPEGTEEPIDGAPSDSKEGEVAPEGTEEAPSEADDNTGAVEGGEAEPEAEAPPVDPEQPQETDNEWDTGIDEEVEEPSEGDQASDDQSGSDSEEPSKVSEDDFDTGAGAVEEEPTDDFLGKTCTSNAECGSADYSCSHTGQCIDAGTLGAFGLGENCSDNEHCAYGLSCIDGSCAEDQ